MLSLGIGTPDDDAPIEANGQAGIGAGVSVQTTDTVETNDARPGEQTQTTTEQISAGVVIAGEGNLSGTAPDPDGNGGTQLSGQGNASFTNPLLTLTNTESVTTNAQGEVIGTSAGQSVESPLADASTQESTAIDDNGNPVVTSNLGLDLPGANLSQTTSSSVSEDGAIVSQSCLLYTSPSPRDATLSRMPSSA